MLHNVAVIVAAALIAIGGAALAQAQTSRPSGVAAGPPERPAICPVTGKPIRYDYRVRFRGRRVYFATADAAAKFQADPYAYRDGVKKQWADLRPLRTQVRCPVTGKPVRPDVFIEQRTRDVYFADEDARKAWLDSPAKYAAKLEQCYTFQTTCGTCENPVRPDVSRDLNGRVVYFCCPGCRGAFDSDRVGFLHDVEREMKANREAWQRERRSPASRPAAPVTHP